MTQTDIERQATRWLMSRDRGEAEGFETWLAADARHRAAYLRLELAWREADRLKALKPSHGPVDPDLLKPAPARRGWAVSKWRTPGFAFASLAAIVVTGAVLFPHIAWRTYSTPVGGYQRLTLSDGSTVELNTDTVLRTRFSDSRRELRLLHGEATFKVVTDQLRPFEVRAAGATVRALGTVFNVRLRAAEKMEVVVTEGRVAVTSPSVPSGRVKSPSVLAAGDAATTTAKGVAIRKVAPVEVKRRLSWQSGELIFQGESLVEAVAEFNRYNRQQLTIADPVLNDLEMGGNFRVTDPGSFVDALQRSFAVKVERGGQGEWILKR